MKIIKLSGRFFPNVFISMIIVSSISYAEDRNDNSWYIGGSIGQSSLNPDENNTNWKITDNKDVSKKVYVGKNFNDRIGIEAFWTDLGNVSVSSKTGGGNGEISYKGYGANAVYNIPYQVGRLKPFAKLGVGRFKTTDKDNASSKQLNTTAIIGGVGVDYEITNQLNLRTEYDYYDKDAQDLNIGLKWNSNYRMHDHNRVQVPQKIVHSPPPPPAPAKIIYREAPPKIVYREAKPKIVYIPKRVVVKEPVKPKFQVMHRNLAGGSNFDTNSAQLTYRGESELNRLVSDIKNQKISVKSIGVVGHTDSVGSHQSNHFLSINRSKSVADYLASRGINRSLIRTEGRGETQPIADNKSKFGRAKNRRVAITINGTSREIIRQ